MWVKTTFSIIQNKEGAGRIYAVYHDMTKEREEQEKLRQQFNDLIVQHYRTPGPDALIVGHCNISQDRILEIIDPIRIPDCWIISERDGKPFSPDFQVSL